VPRLLTTVSLSRCVVKVSKLPKWAIKQAGGVNKKAWRLARRGRKASPKPRRRAVQTRRRTSNPKRSTMRRKKSFNIPLVKTVAGLALFGIAKGSQSSQSVLKDPLNALQQSGQNLIAGKEAAVSIAVASLAAQFLSSDILRKKEIASLGPIRIKV